MILECEVKAARPRGERMIAGQKVHLFEKDIIHKGRWRLPNNGRSFVVSDLSLNHWVQQFQSMKKNGVQVYVPEGHTADPSKNRGWVDDMYVKGGVLMARIALVGDGAKLAGTNAVSIFSPEKFTDGKGNTYRQPIVHVALTPTPVISGQGPFVSIAASNGSRSQVPVYTQEKGNGKMDPNLERLAKAVGVDVSGMDEAAATKAVLAEIAKLLDEEDGEGDTGGGDAAGGEKKMPIAASIKMKELTSEVADLKAKLQEAQKGGKDKGVDKTPIAGITLRLALDNRSMKIDNLVNTGKITPAVAKKLKAQWADEESAGLKLSLEDDGDKIFNETIAALAENDAKVLGTVTGSQAVTLSRKVPGGDDNLSNEEIDKKTKSMAEMMNGKA